MPLPNAGRLERLLAPYAGSKGLSVRVWGVEEGAVGAAPPTPERELYGAGPRLLCLGASDEGLVIVRQTHDGMEDLDGALVPWEQVRRLERNPHLVRDDLTLEVAGRPPLHVGVSNHVLLSGNRNAAKGLCDLAREAARRAESEPIRPAAHAPPPAVPDRATRPIGPAAA